MTHSNMIRKILGLALVVGVVCIAFAACAPSESGTDYGSSMVQTGWALVPPVVAIALALITKEVFSSLFAGILIGAIFYSNFSFHGTLDVMVKEGFIGALSDSWNVGIMIFLVVLGIMVVLMNKAGGSYAYGEWARKRIKTRKGAILSTFGLGCLIFIDDYFNCLTVGSVMRPVTDSHNVSRAKLAYIIDATAAPICMIAPISSWAAAVSGYVKGYNGLNLFIQSIPFNFYSLMTIVMILVLTIGNFDFGPMRRHEVNAIENGDLYTTPERPFADSEGEMNQNEDAKVMDLILPIIVLIICCVIGMIYTGGFFDGTGFVDAFAGSDASYGLSLGSGIALIITMIYYMARGIMSFKEVMDCVPEGFKSMVTPLLILTFAWTLSNITTMLNAGAFVAGLMAHSATAVNIILPVAIFAVACFIGFSTGTSWGTFGILIPIVVAMFPNVGGGTDLPTMLVICISACCAGGVCGDHCSPISDTTIMASTGAQCFHINHVNTQLPYALTAVAFSAIGYVIAGATQSAWISLPATTAITIITLLFIRKKTKEPEVQAESHA
ncbi:MAG: Na+/H+ antiporter NhaC family protein [Anaerovoracaceae bacterium]|jgi:tetracycline resistance efflux pump